MSRMPWRTKNAQAPATSSTSSFTCPTASLGLSSTLIVFFSAVAQLRQLTPERHPFDCRTSGMKRRVRDPWIGSAQNRSNQISGLVSSETFAFADRVAISHAVIGETTSEAAPQTDKACTAPVSGASLPGALYLSQPRTSTQETGFGNLAQLCRSTRLKTSSRDRIPCASLNSRAAGSRKGSPRAIQMTAQVSSRKSATLDYRAAPHSSPTGAVRSVPGTIATVPLSAP